MNNKIYTVLSKVAMLLLLLIFPLFAMAQEDPGPCPDCPIDGGLVLLIAAGAGYGVKKYREAKKPNKQDF